MYFYLRSSIKRKKRAIIREEKHMTIVNKKRSFTYSNFIDGVYNNDTTTG
jgi:hypothetical protein